eukprot:GHVU01073272.1.p1 GENE.GHVU01073272.1~~GHVU01073272.1.p1  ORF type:complete len:769 (-),score=118.27 GHVU01073272.1:951-3257(-)
MGCAGSKKGRANITSDSGSHGSPLTTVPRGTYYDRHGHGTHNRGRNTEEPPRLPANQTEARTEDEKAVLKVESVNFNIAENTAAHYTNQYEITEEREVDGKKIEPQLVIRRGQSFDITITFDRAFNQDKDEIKLIFETGENARESKGTKIIVILSDIDEAKEWGAKVVSTTDNSLRVKIYTPPNGIVAKWNFAFDTILKKADASKVFRYKHSVPVYIIFNPWCTDDQVYMDDDASRQEYVLNDVGKVYRGSSRQISAKKWNFGQFEDSILEAAMYLLDLSELSYRTRGAAVLVARKISTVANSPDDNGVLVGNWSGDYSGGTSPLAWSGSVAILEEYMRTKEPVKYGQCWVFSAVVTTICRALGIPCRSVTNFASAHDCDGSITIDSHWTADGTPMEEFNDDSIWNFHVWNDVWMTRPDLPPGFDGWQAIDATPQETSNGVYSCGPASLTALKNGLVHLPYDGEFIFAEVNGDRIHWIKRQDGNGWHHQKEKHAVGKFISAKGPGAEHMDITNFYKYPEESQQERTAVWRACQNISIKDQKIYSDPPADLHFELVEKDETMIGEAFDVTLKVKNSSSSERNVKVILTAAIVYYTGVYVTDVKKEVIKVKCAPNSDGVATMTVKCEDYLDRLVDMASLKISCMAKVEETEQMYCHADDFRLRKPHLTITAPSEMTVGQEYDVELSFKNPLPRALTKCEFEVEGSGLQKLQKYKQATVGPHAEAKLTVKLKPRRAGQHELIAEFDAKELADVNGSLSILVKRAEKKPTEG